MLKRYGKPDGDEGDAAARFEALIRAAWPWADTDPDTDIAIIAGMKCYGEDREDLDLLVLGTVGPRGEYTPTLKFRDREDQPQFPSSVAVHSFCLVIEVKSHDPTGIKTVGNKLHTRQWVGGAETWPDASEQNFEQVHSFRNYVQKRRFVPPYTVGLIWLISIAPQQLPTDPPNLLGAKFNWDHLLSKAALDCTPKLFDRRWNLTFDSLKAPVAFGPLLRMLTGTTVFTALDRVRMDRIASAAVPPEWDQFLGHKMLILRGRGGTGKTVALLQLAWRATQSDKRVLFLTYNRALAADLRRLWTLLGYPDEGQAGVRVRTAMRFIYQALGALDVLPSEADWTKYEEYKRDALRLFEHDALGGADVEMLRAAHPDAFGWDHVFIDEAQDWPTDERDLLLRLFPRSQFVIADGQDQLIRSGVACNWAAGVAKTECAIQPRGRGLRMKANLTRFVNALAARLGLADWSIDVNPEGGGGEVFVVVGDYLSYTALHQSLLQRNADAGNAVIDLLACVPYQSVSADAATGEARSAQGRRWEQSGQPVWDGVDDRARDGFPTDLDQFRIVQYHSCRGLEGWIAILFGLDLFYANMQQAWKPDPNAEGAPASNPTAAARFAARWLMMPLTRAMDTLVIELTGPGTPLYAALAEVTHAHPDFIHWIE